MPSNLNLHPVAVPQSSAAAHSRAARSKSNHIENGGDDPVLNGRIEIRMYWQAQNFTRKARRIGCTVPGYGIVVVGGLLMDGARIVDVGWNSLLRQRLLHAVPVALGEAQRILGPH